MLLAQLREATAAAHRALEDAVDIAAVLQDEVRYRQLLEDFYGFHGPLEERLLGMTAWQEQPHQPAARRKAPWLEDDLRAFGLGQAAVRSLPACAELPPNADLASAYGCAYVLEGSTLGGRHILHLFGEGPAATWPQRFFTGYGAETGPRWKEFCAALERAAAALPQAHVLAAAEQTFACLNKWLARERKLG